MNIFEQVKAAGIEYDNHESDLYIPVNDATAALIAQYEFKANVRVFTCNITKKIWYDIPFAYTPFWDKKKKTIETIEDKEYYGQRIL